MSGYKTFADQEVLQAADLNGYLMSQAVPRFADTTARGAAIGAPEDGQLAYAPTVGLQIREAGQWQSIARVTPVYTTALRPAASSVAAGTMVYDSTLGKPVWSTGAAWNDATGTAA
jgi:hypothetical protein